MPLTTLHLIVYTKSLTEPLKSLLIWLEYLGCYFYLPSSGVVGKHHHAQLLRDCKGSNSGSPACVPGTLPTKPSPQIPHYLFDEVIQVGGSP